eukprot:362948-Chlamydomonas_euryale.AAC.14
MRMAEIPGPWRFQRVCGSEQRRAALRRRRVMPWGPVCVCVWYYNSGRRTDGGRTDQCAGGVAAVPVAKRLHRASVASSSHGKQRAGGVAAVPVAKRLHRASVAASCHGKQLAGGVAAVPVAKRLPRRAGGVAAVPVAGARVAPMLCGWVKVKSHVTVVQQARGRVKLEALERVIHVSDDGSSPVTL